jgi:hypothetical protein
MNRAVTEKEEEIESHEIFNGRMHMRGRQYSCNMPRSLVPSHNKATELYWLVVM